MRGEGGNRDNTKSHVDGGTNWRSSLRTRLGRAGGHRLPEKPMLQMERSGRQETQDGWDGSGPGDCHRG